MANDHEMQCYLISVRIPLSNAIVERVHQTIDNIKSTFIIQNTDTDNKNPWKGTLSSTMFAITQHRQLKLVFGRDAFQKLNQ